MFIDPLCSDMQNLFWFFGHFLYNNIYNILNIYPKNNQYYKIVSTNFLKPFKHQRTEDILIDGGLSLRFITLIQPIATAQTCIHVMHIIHTETSV